MCWDRMSAACDIIAMSLSVCWGLWTCSPQVPPAPPTSPCMRMMVANSADQWCYTFGFLKQIVSRLGFPTAHCTRIRALWVLRHLVCTQSQTPLSFGRRRASLQSECSRRVLSPLWIWLLDVQFTFDLRLNSELQTLGTDLWIWTERH